MAEQSWTDDPITAGQNRIRKKSIHFTELQDAINAWETSYSIENTNFTNSPAAGVKINSSAITEMQDALDALYQLANSTDFSWTEASTPKTIKPVHMNELRTNMNIMQNDYCYQCDSCDTDTGCNLCDTGCHGDVCSQCNASCHGYSACSCNSTCYSEYCSSCYNRCYGECDKQACSCYGTCYSAFSCSCNSTCYGHSACSCNSTCNVDPCDLCNAACYEDICAHCDNSTYRYPWT